MQPAVRIKLATSHLEDRLRHQQAAYERSGGDRLRGMADATHAEIMRRRLLVDALKGRTVVKDGLRGKGGYQRLPAYADCPAINDK